jgi:hypothetical protein
MAWYCISPVHIHLHLHTCSVYLQQNMTFMYFYKQDCGGHSVRIDTWTCSLKE